MASATKSRQLAEAPQRADDRATTSWRRLPKEPGEARRTDDAGDELASVEIDLNEIDAE